MLLNNLAGQQKYQRRKFKNIWRQIEMKLWNTNVWDAGKAVPRGKLIMIQAYLKKTRKISSKQSNLTS